MAKPTKVIALVFLCLILISSNAVSETNASQILASQPLRPISEAGVTSEIARRSSEAQASSEAGVPSQVGTSANLHMILLWDGGAAPAGWSLLSEFDGRFFRGSPSYGPCDDPPCGSENHTHAVEGQTDPANPSGFNKFQISPDPNVVVYLPWIYHYHKIESAEFYNTTASNRPGFRTLQLIRYDDGIPARIPAGAIAVFDTTSLSADWTRYAAQDGRFVMAYNAAGRVGGSNDPHQHLFYVTLTGPDKTWAPANPLLAGHNPSLCMEKEKDCEWEEPAWLCPERCLSEPNHTHTRGTGGLTSSESTIPSFISVVLAQAGRDTPIPLGMIGMFDNSNLPAGWNILSNQGGPFYRRFILPYMKYGEYGGSDSHTHASWVHTSSRPNATCLGTRCICVPGTGPFGCPCNRGMKEALPPVPLDGRHTHDIVVVWEPASHLPPYFNVIFAKSMVKPVSVTFQLNGVGSDASGTGTVLMIDEIGYTYGQLSGGKTFEWYSDSTHSVSATTVPAGSEKQYSWRSWENGDGLNGASGTYTTPSSPQTVTANYKTRYKLTVVTDPPGSTPQPTVDPPGPWYDAPASVTCTAEAVSGYDFSYWDVDEKPWAVGVNPITITMDGPHRATAHYMLKLILPLATIASSPVGGAGFVKVDGNDVTTAYYLWQAKDYTIAANDFAKVTAQSRYRFSSWSDGLGQSHGITVKDPSPLPPPTYTAYFVRQYGLTVATNPSGLSPQPTVDPATIDGWYDEGASVTCTAGAVDNYVFSYWDVDGMPWLIGINPVTVTMDGPHLMTAHYIPTTQVTITSSPTGSGFVKVDGTPIDTTTPQTFIWPQGSSHALEALSPVSGGTGIQYVWLTFSDHGDRVHTYITPSSPETVTANYKTQYHLALETNPPSVTTPTGAGWYEATDPPTTASIWTEQYIEEVPESSRYRFIEWTTADMSEIADPDADSTQVTVDDPKTVTANYASQSYLTSLTDPPDLPLPPLVDPPGPWYDNGKVVTVAAIDSEGYQDFAYWEVDGVNWGRGKENCLLDFCVYEITVTVASGHTAIAHYSAAAPVGGDLVPTSKLMMLSPYLLLLALVGAVSVVIPFAARRRHKT